MNKVLIITGPTGSGKTKVSIEVAKHFNTEIINGDAFQVYRGMDILTAKIKPAEMEGIKHHLFDIINPTEEFNVATYQKLVRELIEEFTKRNKLPLIVGGSGLYLNSVIYDYDFSTTGRSDETKYDHLTDDELHDILKKLNENAALKIHPHNRKRVIRAIELAQNNAIINEFNNKLLYDAKIIYLNVDREILYERINKRVDDMINDGLIEEVKSLIKLDLSKTALGAIGLKEMIPYIEGIVSKETAIMEVKKNTRHYAKRQLTWFRHQNNINIVDVNYHNFQETINQIIQIVDEWLHK